MVTQNVLYDAILYVYALSLLFYFSDFINASRKAKRIGAGLLIFVWVLQTVYVAAKTFSHFHLMPVTPFEYWLWFSWLLVTVSLVISRFFKIDYIVFFVNVIGFAVLALNLYSSTVSGQSLELWQTTRELLYVHISLVLCAYAVLTIGALFAGMYLFLHNRLKGKRWTKSVRRLPSLEMMERYMDRAVIVGVPLLALSIAIAAVSLIVEDRAGLLLDWKVLTSVATLALFIAFVYRRAAQRWPGPRMAWLYLASFIMLLMNLLSNYVSRFH